MLAPARSVVCLDWPGHGRADKPDAFDYSPGGYARFLVGALDALGLRRADVVGNSLGGLIGLFSALTYPDRVGKLALIGTPTYPESRPTFLWPLRWPVLGPLLEAVLGPWCVALCARQVFVDRSVVTPELLETYSAALRTPQGRRAIAAFVRNAVPADAEALVARYRELPHPTLILWGERDCMVRRRDAERLAMELPNSKLVCLPGAGHAPQEERPDEIARLLLDFLA